VKIEFDAERTTPKAKPDADGIVRWSLIVSARGQAHIDLQWKMSSKDSVKTG